MENPKISVLMSVYNGEKYLRESVDSILNQTFKNFEFLIMEDGSTDNSLKILRSYEDKRIKIIENKKNIGLVCSLNKGLKRAKGKYIARMDADDISYSERFEKQLAFMEDNKNIDICGSAIKLFGAKKEIWSPPLAHNEIFTGMLFESMLYHPTVFMRKNSILSKKQFYDENYKYAQDNEFWIRLAFKGLKFANLKDILLKYRTHCDNIGVVHNATQKENSDRARLKFFEALKIKDFQNKMVIHNLLKNGKNIKKEDFKKISEWITELLEANKKQKIFKQKFLEKELNKRWLKVCYNSSCNGFLALRQFKKQPDLKNFNLKFIKELKFLVRCLLRIKS